MSYPLVRVPKPKRKRKTRKPLCRGGRLSPKGKRGSAFPKQRDKAYCRWVATENQCLLYGAFLPRRVSIHDEQRGLYHCYVHRCFGGMTPAHVGKHRAKGAPDFGCVVPLCRAAHQFYDEHRSEWKAVTGFSEKRMASEASGLALRYLESGGKPRRAA